ncbi:hypothetical protein C5167_022625 [Papaver somniferum]|uniref:RRM domain-containing protein n=3 Tax=Papaver somniferum TaxID=3469 RepID=A0A4Y7JMA4_PAPSO|nr:hypothetical protein C5167_022625 [Papaver somniferum]
MSGQTQFRYTQTPSKVLHLRNLPWECIDEELVELCKPFGKIVNTKCNVGANRNQAFVEFVDLNQAISMVSYYASSSDPAQVRGKTVYIQYSNRQEIVNNKSSGDIAGNVLLVTIEGVEAGDVSIDVIHLVFSAFGYVQKIATFEKAAGFQALIQFTDAVTASSARDALDGRSIPKYLLPEHVDSCNLRISYSAHTDLNIKFQSHRSRDYTNPYLPVNPSAIEGTMQPVVGPDGKRKEPESNVLLASIENLQYAVTVDVLHTVFSAFGTVQKIAIFDKNGGMQALVQYPDVTTAAAAKEALEGHCIYDGGYCKLHLSYSRHTDLNVKAHNDRSRDFTLPESAFLPMQQVSAAPTSSTSWQNPQSAYPGAQHHDGHTYSSPPTTFPGHPAYSTAGSSSYLPPGHQGSSGMASKGMPSYSHQPNVRPPGSASYAGQPPYYGQEMSTVTTQASLAVFRPCASKSRFLSGSSGKLTREVSVKTVTSTSSKSFKIEAKKGQWLPGLASPGYLTGSLPGDNGFDPLGLAEDPENLKWFVQAELVNGRWAMLGVAGMLLPELFTKIGIINVPEWYDAGKAEYFASNSTLFVIEFILFHYVEIRRWQDIKNPGSVNQDPIFKSYSLPKGEVGYPGGIFNPLNFSATEEAKEKEVANGRLAMLAFLGFVVQHNVTGKGPLDNLGQHLADPWHNTIIQLFK